MEEENKEDLVKTADKSELDINKVKSEESFDNTAENDTQNSKTEEFFENTVEQNTEAQKTEETVENTSEMSASETKTEESEKLEYGTMPGSWASYEAEQQKNRYSGNGVYPDNESGRINGGNYFGAYNGGNGSYYGQSPWQNRYPSNEPQKPKDKKRFILFGVLGAVMLALIVSAVIGGFQLFNRMMDGLDDVTPSLGEQSGGGQQSGGSGQPNGGTEQPSGGGASGTTNAGKESLQNGSFTLEQVPADEHYKLSSVYQLTESAVVAIKSSIGSGSGVIIAKDETNNDGYFILTNNHVIEGGENIKVTLSNGVEYSAVLIGRDENTDLAILKIVASDLKVASIGKSGDLLVAEEVLIIGNPLGTLGGSATNGIISAKNRELTIDGYTMSLLQTNAAVNPGNSGGGMFNMSGQLVGVVNAKFTDEAVEGIGFAIPIDTAKPIIEDLINYGYVKGRPNLGFEITYGTNSIEWKYDYWVIEIQAGSDAEAAGLKFQDVIRGLKVNGVNYIGEDLSAYLKTLKIGDVLEITVRRYTQTGFNSYSPKDEVITFTVTEYQG